MAQAAVRMHGTSDKFVPIVEEWNNRWSEYSPTFLNVAELRNDKGIELRRFSEIPLGTMSTFDGFGNLTEKTYGPKHVDTFTRVSYGNISYRTTAAVNDDPSILPKLVADYMLSMRKTIDKAFWGDVTNWFGSTVIDDGNSGTTAVISAGHAYNSGASTQTNLLTSALSNDSLITAETKLAEWVDENGDPMELGTGLKVLCIPEALKHTAYKLVGSPLLREVTSDATNNVAVSGANINTVSGFGIQVVPWWGDAQGGDDDDWVVMDQTNGKLAQVWIPHLPQLAIGLDEKNHQYYVSVSFEMKVIPPQRGDGVIGSNVA